ncbi:proton-conducting transporter transmembrane domain-containing protein [Thiocystis violacea]|uniref:proton-conducting transporter transmembrane domain-containing protein n=1 Tax=Thiocystis violacea TaxID=13725 RepID=UPI0019066D34|nr:proton-conducting transporter membrane subunit [Thiocystis violacea]MBK1721047.1 sodium:proton antiporter [Thiocystis violacea]
MSLILKLFFFAVSLSPTALLMGWDGHLTWTLLDGVGLSLTLTPLAAFFLLLLALAAPLVALPMLRRPADWPSLALYAALLAGMQLLLLAGDFVSFFIGWEIMTWSSYLLLLRSPRTEMATSQSYILFNLASAFLLLAGIMVFYGLTGSFDIRPLVGPTQPQQLALALLFGLAFLIKVGTLPLHIWVPRSYDEAPDIFSAFLSAAISKMGVYGMILLLTLFPEALTGLYGRLLNGPAAGYLLAWVGVITAIVATYKAISQEDMKRLLAYSSIAQVGYITTAVGVGSSLALGGALYLALVHTLVKLLLFISVAGIVLQTGQRRFNDLGRLIERMPISFFGVLIGIIGLAGMPPLPGFAAKYLVFVSLVDARWLLLLAAMILSSTAAFIYCYKLIYAPFLGHANSAGAREAKEAPWPYLVPQVILMALLFGLGVFPGFAIEVLIDPVLTALRMAPLGGSSWAVLTTAYGGYDGVVLMSVFVTAFVLVTGLFLLLRGRMRRAGSPYDLSYAGEVPTEETPLHYGAGMGRELRRIPLVGWILRHSSQGFYLGLTRQMRAAAGLLGGFYAGNPQTWILLAVVVFAVVLGLQAVTGGI